MPIASDLINIAPSGQSSIVGQAIEGCPEMQTIKMIKTGEIVRVTKNVAHGLIERGEAVLYAVGQALNYNNRSMQAVTKGKKSKKNYKVK